MRPREPGRRSRTWREREPRRATCGERGYNARWQRTSEQYRIANPLCVLCLLAGYVRPSRCVDHILPAHSCPSLFWDPDNWAALCLGCHARKTRREPRHEWTPDPARLVICGLPGTGKTTLARSLARPYWDADERPELVTAAAIIAARDQWLEAQAGPLAVIVASPMTASLLAGRIGGAVLHCTERYVERPAKNIAAA